VAADGGVGIAPAWRCWASCPIGLDSPRRCRGVCWHARAPLPARAGADGARSRADALRRWRLHSGPSGLARRAVVVRPGASETTAHRVLKSIAQGCSTPSARPGRGRAPRGGRARVPSGWVLNIDATLVVAHSGKERAAAKLDGRRRLYPLLCFLDGTDDALAGCCGQATLARTRPATTSGCWSRRPSNRRHTRSTRRSSCAQISVARRTTSPRPAAPPRPAFRSARS
jgi:hypothetical protein